MIDFSVVFFFFRSLIARAQAIITVELARTIAMYAALGFGLLCVVLFVSSRFLTREQNSSSRCNRRQAFSWTSFMLLLFLGFLLLYWFSPGVAYRTIQIVFFGTEMLSIFFWFYDPGIYILSRLLQYRQPKPHCEPTPEKLNRFAIIACAHNEENVIDHLVRSVYATDYPRNLFDIYVLCDNCTDATAERARAAGAIAVERNEPDRRGKAFGLEWMFAYLKRRQETDSVYDAYIILDADNVVNEEFLDAINTKMNGGYELMQAYLGCKNPKDTWISTSYSYVYWVSNALYQQAHAQLGLSAQVGGTGIVIRPQLLDEIGWDTDSLTEDLVLTARYTLQKNRACMWVENAKLYDEKPLKLKPSIRQRTRWMQGHMAAMIKYAPKLLGSGLRHMSLKQLDVAFYLLRPFLNFLMFTGYLATLGASILLPGMPDVSFVMDNDTGLLLVIGILILQFYVLFRERYARYIPSFIWQIFFSFTWYPAIVRGIIKHRERYWVSTAHTRNLSIYEVAEDAQMHEARERLRGLGNLHRLPIGQILMKAGVITRKQLDAALARQRDQGGRLGEIIVEMTAVSQPMLTAYRAVQQDMKDKAEREGREEERVQLEDMLLSAGVVAAAQLESAQEYQHAHGGELDDALLRTRCLPPELLDLFLDMQGLLDANYVSAKHADRLVRGVLANTDEDIGTLLWRGGLIGLQQLQHVQELQQEQHLGEEAQGELLVRCEFIGEETLALIRKLQRTGRAFLSRKKQGEPGAASSAEQEVSDR